MHASLDASYIEESLRAAFGETLQGIVLYGSQATGHATAGSDIDLAVLISGQTSQQLLWDKAQELACHFIDILSPLKERDSR
ncbi:nucleotidyltransferase domain-containing protein [Endozoicomonas sp. SESOKO3]|uniref:nucleotidyltransferase domain-containing protein n=1 Tax=Endozoicomonas sp. SESOKO3 TaxID=2828744 RepID=UPI002147317E|nr:nucleotidyltransferase domain-containing protein [Endozoicomonas sp. SESOKO3]